MRAATGAWPDSMQAAACSGGSMEHVKRGACLLQHGGHLGLAGHLALLRARQLHAAADRLADVHARRPRLADSICRQQVPDVLLQGPRLFSRCLCTRLRVCACWPVPWRASQGALLPAPQSAATLPYAPIMRTCCLSCMHCYCRGLSWAEKAGCIRGGRTLNISTKPTRTAKSASGVAAMR